MTAVSGAGSTLSQQLYQKLFDRLNVDADEAVSLQEMTVAVGDRNQVSKVFETLDADRDGRISKAEMTPSDAFGAQTLAALIGAQTGPKAPSDEEYLADWFAKTDTDGDGLVSKDERHAAADLRRAAAYDAGYMATRSVMVRSGASNEEPLTVDQFQAVTIKSLGMDISKVRFAEDGPPEMLDLMNRFRTQSGQPPLPGRLTDEERQNRLDHLQADIDERNSAPDGARGFLSRELDRLRAEEAVRIAEADQSAALAAQLFQRVLDGWTPRPENGPVIV